MFLKKFKFVKYLQDILNLKDNELLNKHTKKSKNDFSFWKTT